MRITVFGAAGQVGARVVREALERGHQVVAVVRDGGREYAFPAGVEVRVGDAASGADVAAASAGGEVVISATRPAAGREHELLEAAQGLLAGLAHSGIRLLLVGGSAGLLVPGTGLSVIDAPGYPEEWRPIGLACVDQLKAVEASEGVDWTYLSPPALLEPGVRTGRYRVGSGELLVDADGTSAISMEDFAVALLDEAERPRHRGVRFTVAS